MTLIGTQQDKGMASGVNVTQEEVESSDYHPGGGNLNYNKSTEKNQQRKLYQR